VGKDEVIRVPPWGIRCVGKFVFQAVLFCRPHWPSYAVLCCLTPAYCAALVDGESGPAGLDSLVLP